jgi:hypothetical protein
VEFPCFFEEKSPEKELVLVFQPQPVIKPEIFGNDTMVKGFTGNKLPLLPADVKLIKKLRNGPVQYQYTHNQGYYNNNLHKVRFSFCLLQVFDQNLALHGCWMGGFRQDKIAC